MGSLVIQSGIRHGRFAELTRSNGERLSIGRGFNNDLVLTDPHVAPNQLEFCKMDDHWFLTVLDDVNPIKINGKTVSGQVAIESGDHIAIGRTKLVAYTQDHAVAPTKKLLLSNLLSGSSLNPLWPIVVLLLTTLVSFGLEYVESATSFEWEKSASEILLSIVFIVIWAGCWALAGRIFRHQHHMGLQLIATSFISLLSVVLLMAAEFVVYPFHSVKIEEAMLWVFFYVVFSAMLYCNLVLALNVQRPARVSCVLVAITLAVFYGFETFEESSYYASSPEYSTSVKPPILGVYKGVSGQDYWQAVSVMIEQEHEVD